VVLFSLLAVASLRCYSRDDKPRWSALATIAVQVQAVIRNESAWGLLLSNRCPAGVESFAFLLRSTLRIVCALHDGLFRPRAEKKL